MKELLNAGLKAHGRCLMWDLDGIRGGTPQLDLYRRFEGRGLWVDAGARNVDTLVDILVAGADVAVINQRRMGRLEEYTEASQLSGQLAICVEEGVAAKGANPQRHDARPSDLFREAQRGGIERGVYLNHKGLGQVPTWVSELEGMELYAGPVPIYDGRPRSAGRVVADLFELV